MPASVLIVRMHPFILSSYTQPKSIGWSWALRTRTRPFLSSEWHTSSHHRQEPHPQSRPTRCRDPAPVARDAPPLGHSPRYHEGIRVHGDIHSLRPRWPHCHQVIPVVPVCRAHAGLPLCQYCYISVRVVVSAHNLTTDQYCGFRTR